MLDMFENVSRHVFFNKDKLYDEKHLTQKNRVTLFLYRDMDMTLKRARSDVFDRSRLVRRWSASFLTLYYYFNL
jgi:hypothetical protein